MPPTNTPPIPRTTPTLAGVGLSGAITAWEAGREAATTACLALGGRRPDFVLVFGTTGYDQGELLGGVRSVTGEASLGGCSGEGVIGPAVTDEGDRSVAVLVVASPHFRFEPLVVPGYDLEPDGCARRLAEAVAARGVDDVVGLWLFPDGLTGDCRHFLQTLAELLPTIAPVVGGTAGDAMEFRRTYQYHGGEVASGALAAVVIRGGGELRVAVAHGCLPIGTERTVTRARGGWLVEIDGRPAWSVFKDYLDGDPEDLNAEGIVHLCVGEPLPVGAADSYEPYIIHTPLQLDKATGALFFPGGGLTEGMRVRLTRRDPEQIRASAAACAHRVMAPGGVPAFVLQLDCAGRGRILFGSCAAEEIVTPLQRVVGRDVPWIGFHTYGEIAPIGTTVYYHNYTVALCAAFDPA